MALTYTEAQIQAKLDKVASIDTLEDDVEELSETVNAIPHIYSSTSEPTSSDGNNGDIWIVLES